MMDFYKSDLGNPEDADDDCECERVVETSDTHDAQRWSSAAAQEERSDEGDVGCNELLGVMRTYSGIRISMPHIAHAGRPKTSALNQASSSGLACKGEGPLAKSATDTPIR